MAENLEKKFLGTEGVQKLIENVRSEIADSLQDAKDYAGGLADNYDAAGTATTKVGELANGQVKSNKEAIEKLNGDATTDGSIANRIAAAEETLNQAILAAEKKADDAQADADALETEVGDVDSLSTTNKTVVGAINEVLAAVGTGGTAAVVTVTSDTTTEGALKSYTIKQGNATVGVIDIPKDMVVESGSVVTLKDGDVEGHAAGTYIKLVLANISDPLYINVGTLIDIYKAKASASQVQISVDSTSREISASIVAGSITDTELASDSVTTAKIASNNVTKEKLSASVQNSLDKIDTIETSLAEGGNTANAIADAKKAGTDAQGLVTGLENGKVADLRTDVDALKSVTYTEITASDVDAMFA